MHLPAVSGILKLGPSFQRPKQRYLVDVFQISAYGHTAGDPCNSDPGRLDQLADIHCCRFAFQTGIGCNNNLLHI